MENLVEVIDAVIKLIGALLVLATDIGVAHLLKLLTRVLLVRICCEAVTRDGAARNVRTHAVEYRVRSLGNHYRLVACVAAQPRWRHMQQARDLIRPCW